MCLIYRSWDACDFTRWGKSGGKFDKIGRFICQWRLDAPESGGKLSRKIKLDASAVDSWALAKNKMSISWFGTPVFGTFQTPLLNLQANSISIIRINSFAIYSNSAPRIILQIHLFLFDAFKLLNSM